MKKASNGFINLTNYYLSPQPRSVEGENNTSYFFYRAQLYCKVFSIFIFENIPYTWNLEYLLNVLFSEGYIAIVDSGVGVLPLKAGISGFNIYDFPTTVDVANPVLGTFKRTIGVDCELLYFSRFSDHFMSLEPLIKRYAMLLSSCDCSLNTSLINSRVAQVFIATADAELESYKKIFDDVSMGKPAVFLKKPIGGSLLESNSIFSNVKNTYIGNDILKSKRTIMNEFLTEIGINNANTDKRERLITDEVNSNNGETLSLVSLWLNTMRNAITRINKLFNLNISVRLNPQVVTALTEVTENESD